MKDRLRVRRARARPFAYLIVVIAALLSGPAMSRVLATQKARSRPRMELVELDAVVVDKNGRTVHGLQLEDFQIKEDGQVVAVTSFTEVSAAGIGGRQDGRSLVLLLDDTSIGPRGTLVVKNIARMFLAVTRPGDAVAVVRLTHRADEAVGDVQSALERVDTYQAGSVPYFGRETIEDSLQAVTRISRQLESMEHRRKALVCVGGRTVCDLFLPAPETTLIWPFWRDALSATARANVSVYLVDPSGVSGGVDLGGGLVSQTGGADFVASNNFQRAVDQIWDEAGHYYLLSYAPMTPSRDLHSIDISVKRSGVHVRARRRRGD